MVILEDLRKYQASLELWAVVLRGISSSDASIVDPLMDLLELGRPLPRKVVAAAFDFQLRHAYQNKDVHTWCRILVGQSDSFPKRLVDCIGDFLDSQQVTSIMNCFLEVLRASDKLKEFCQILKELSPYISSIKNDAFRVDLQILCDAATIQSAKEEAVADIHLRFGTLLEHGTDEKPASKFQKALMFFSTGLAFASMVEKEVRLVTELAGLDMDLKAVEETVKVWPAFEIVNEEAASAAQVPRKSIELCMDWQTGVWRSMHTH